MDNNQPGIVPLPPAPPSVPRRLPAPPVPPPVRFVPIARPNPIPAAAPPAPTPSKSVKAPLPAISSAPSAIVLRTMQDDIAAVKAAPALVPHNGPSGNSAQKTVPSAVSAATAKSQDNTPAPAAARTLPLPPITSGRQQKIVVPPRKQKPRVIFIAVIGSLILILSATGAAGWWYFQNRGGFSNNPGTLAQAAELLPANASLIVQYKITSTEQRAAIASAWNNSGETASITSLLRGDPRLLLNDPDLSELYFILLPQDTRPYLLIPRTAFTKQALSQSPDASTELLRGWYLANSVGTNPYKDALSRGVLAADNRVDELNKVPAEAPVRLMIGSGMLAEIKKDMAGDWARNGQWQNLVLAGRFVPGASGQGMELSGLAQTITAEGNPLTASVVADQQLLTIIPGNASFILVGSSFYDDLAVSIESNSFFDKTVLNRSEVQALFRQFTSSFAIYLQNSINNNQQLGLIITMPDALRETIVLGDPALETGLTSFIPALTGRPNLAPGSFNSGVYNDVPLRYLNLSGSSAALDYAFVDKYLLIATSKEAMFNLLDTVAGKSAPLTSAPAWQPFFSAWGAIPSGESITLSVLDMSALRPFLPITAGQTPSIGLVTPAAAGLDKTPFQAFLHLPGQAQASSSSSPLAP